MKRITQEELISMRRQLHRIPEIGLEEYETHEYIIKKLNQLPQEKLSIDVQNTAIIVKVKGNNPTKNICWRTDMDGLPITEETQLVFSSKNQGKMHACGHDFHMTIALGLLENMVDSDLDNDVIFFFQPAEENLSGAKIYTDNHFLNVGKIDRIYGLHVSPELPVGVVSTCEGTLCAGDCGFEVIFTGKESHAALPHEGNDMIVASAAFIQQVQTIISRNINPMSSSVITFGQLSAGVADNVLPGKAVLSGTIRTLSHEMTDLVLQRFKEIADGIALSFQCEVAITFNQLGYVPVVNNSETTKDLVSFFNTQDIIVEEASPIMTAEDFGYLLKQIPGTMFWLGVDSEYGLHHSKFDPDEAALIKAVDLMTNFLLDWDKN